MNNHWFSLLERESYLASVVGRLTAKPIIAVPTSIGYVVNYQGLASSHNAKFLCAQCRRGKIDNRFGAEVLAHRINKGVSSK